MKTLVIESGKGSENGKAASTTAKKNEKAGSTAKPQPAAKMDAQKPEPKPENKLTPLVTPSERFERAEQFSKLQKRFEFLKERKRELDNFNISHDGSASKIELSNPTGGHVVISNPEVMKEVLNLCSATIKQLLDRTESEVLEFEI